MDQTNQRLDFNAISMSFCSVRLLHWLFTCSNHHEMLNLYIQKYANWRKIESILHRCIGVADRYRYLSEGFLFVIFFSTFVTFFLDSWRFTWTFLFCNAIQQMLKKSMTLPYAPFVDNASAEATSKEPGLPRQVPASIPRSSTFGSRFNWSRDRWWWGNMVFGNSAVVRSQSCMLRCSYRLAGILVVIIARKIIILVSSWVLRFTTTVRLFHTGVL